MVLNSALALLLLAAIASGYNLSPKYAKIYKTPSEGMNGSYFGYAVALQRQDTSSSISWLLVGAPRANSSLLAQASIVEPGVVFQCGVTSPRDACIPLVLDTTGNTVGLETPRRMYYRDRKDNAWIGGAIDALGSEGGSVACGSRWSNQYEKGHYLMNGICYWTNHTSTLVGKHSTRLLPLVNRGLQGRKSEKNSDLFYYASGGAGFSTHLTKNTQELLIGAPGVYDWTGTVIRYNVNGIGRNTQKPPNIPNPHLNSQLENSYVYFGYSVDSGTFLKSSPNKTHYVGGAPRGANLKGLVLVFDFPDADEEKMDVLIELKGYQLGEYFGASLCVVDLNGDGLDDLLVGAPLHSVASSPGSKQHSGDEGRVYVFINKGNGVMKEIGDTNQMTGSTDQGARFGSCIAKLGDLNMDGFNDIAVGAPYEDHGKGAIYIYHGRQSGINPKYSQRIAASAFPQAISGFGISISRGLDIDGNHYNDIAVGAYTSGHAVLIRSQPVIRLVPRLTSNVEHIVFDTAEFTVTACLQYHGTHAPPSVDANITLHVHSHDSRAVFSTLSSLQINTTIYFTFQLKYQSEKCSNISVEITKGETGDFTKPIELRMDYQIIHMELWATQKGEVVVDDFCQTCAVVDPAAVSYVTRTVPYATGCRDDSVCHTDLVVQATLQDLTPPFILGTEAKLRMKIAVKNIGESAFLVRVNVTFSSATPLSRLPPECQEVTSQEDTSQDVTSQLIQLECDVANPLSTDSEASFFLEVDTSGLSSSTDQLTYWFHASGAGKDVNPSNNARELRVAVESEADLAITGSSSHQILIYSNVSQTFTHTYEVKNVGPSPVNQVLLELQIPVALVTSLTTVVFLEVFPPTTTYISTTEKQPFSCTTSGGYSFISNAERGNMHKLKRSVNDTILDSGQIEIDTIQLTFNNTLFANCSNGDIRCITVSCSVGPFLTSQTSAVISLQMRANLTSIGSLIKNTNIKINTLGKVKILDSSKIRQPVDDTPDNSTVATLLILQGKMPDKQVSWWLLVLAIAGGLLVLLIVTGVLYKIGFFTRELKESMEHLEKNESVGGKSNAVDDGRRVSVNKEEEHM